MLFLALGQSELNLGKTSLGEIDAERDKCKPLLLRLAQKFIDFLAVEEQFPRAKGLVVHDVAVTVRTDVAMVEKNLAALHAGVTVL